LNWVRL